jgi:hypothetical protein
MGPIDVIVLCLLVLSELFTSSIVVLLPAYDPRYVCGLNFSYIGKFPVAEHCTSAATYVECTEEFFSEEIYSNQTATYKDKLHTTFLVYSISAAVRITVSVVLGLYLSKSHALKVFNLLCL